MHAALAVLDDADVQAVLQRHPSLDHDGERFPVTTLERVRRWSNATSG